ncbi:hypothetical protein OCC_07731 [Thermococcus litoralis DSM 5473]|uniref:DUF86 domain-containing protein n=2 Tax=Thermococcus litoralis TaxID=2265 RepID=H3ZL33_THELN|nr:hypothetical protein OCC_07731 [Thermococcus litoralis DSM 5473]
MAFMQMKKLETDSDVDLCIHHNSSKRKAFQFKMGMIGEVAKNVPKEIQQKYPQIPWKEIAGMRDRLIHAYFGVDLEIVWLPKLESELSRGRAKNESSCFHTC